MSGKSAKGTDTPSSSKSLEKISTQINKELTPLRGELTSQLMEALTTGGVGARIPQIQAMTEQSKMATSNALKQTSDSLAASGLAGTPYGERILAETGMQGALSTAQIPSNVISQMLQVIPSYTLGQGNTVVSGLSGASQGQMNAANNAAAKDQAIMAAATKMIPTFNFGTKI